MRFYRIEFTPPVATSQNPNPPTALPAALTSVLVQDTTKATTTYVLTNELLDMSGAPTGTVNPRALMAEINVTIGSGATADIGASYIKIYGISPVAIANIRSLAGWNVRVYGGFKAGLPIATALSKKPGANNPLFYGFIQAPFGNSVRPNLEATLPIIVPMLSAQTRPQLFGAQGTSLSDAVNQTLTTYYPTLPVQVEISSEAVFTEDTHHACYNLQDFITTVQGISTSLLGTTYPGYTGALGRFLDDTLIIRDTQSFSGANTIAIPDIEMIGPPVYVGDGTFQVVTPMRADIRINDNISIASVTALQVGPQVGISSSGLQPGTISGSHSVLGIQHVGNTRSPDGSQGWCTVYTCSDIANTESSDTLLLGISSETVQNVLQPFGQYGTGNSFGFTT